MSDIDKILSDDDLDEEIQDAPETEAPETPEEPETPKSAEPEKEEPKEQPMVPLAALHEVRDSNRDLKRQLESLQAQSRQEPQKAPDVLEDQDGYNGYIQQQIQQTTFNARLDISEGIARDTYGDEAVEAAFEAAKATGMARNFVGGKHPWGEMVKWHQKQQKMAEIGDDPDGWRERERQKIRQELEAELVAKSVTSGSGPSLSGEPNLGSRTAREWGGPTSLDDILKG